MTHDSIRFTALSGHFSQLTAPLPLTRCSARSAHRLWHGRPNAGRRRHREPDFYSAGTGAQVGGWCHDMQNVNGLCDKREQKVKIHSRWKREEIEHTHTTDTIVNLCGSGWRCELDIVHGANKDVIKSPLMSNILKYYCLVFCCLWYTYGTRGK